MLIYKGSAEEQIKRELQAVAEGVAASVFNSSVISNPDLSVHPTTTSPPTSQQNCDSQNANEETQQSDKFDVCDHSIFSQHYLKHNNLFMS